MYVFRCRKMGKDAIGAFDPYSDPDKTALRWKAWKRNLHLYLVSKDIHSDTQKIAKLLFFAGPVVQSIYVQAKKKKDEENETESDDAAESEYMEALEILDGIFLKQNNEPYQRTIFRQMKQKPEEKVSAFLVRLREQAEFCNFGDMKAVEKAIKDQIITGGTSEKLRHEMLKRERSLDKIAELASSIENVEQYEKAKKTRALDEGVNEIESKKPRRENFQHNAVRSNKMRCWACNQEGHKKGDRECNARTKKCLKCGRVGHFSVCCKARDKKRTFSGKVRHVDDAENSEEEYIFHVGGKSQKTMKCIVGGVEIQVLIDSGTRRNLIPLKTWEYMKKQSVKTREMIKGSDVAFKAYGQSEVIPVKGRFEALLELNGKKTYQWFYVVEKGDTSLLGEDTSIVHDVLRIGTTVNSVDEQAFPKIKGTEMGNDW
jgi:hypothetical protein